MSLKIKVRMKHLPKTIFTFLLFVPLSGCISQLGSNALTKAKAQMAVDPALAAAKQQHGKVISASAKGIVEGVQDISQENTAKADVRYVNAVSTCLIDPFIPSKYSWTQGVATFKRYNDGRWVLTEITTGEMMCFAGWQPNIEVR